MQVSVPELIFSARKIRALKVLRTRSISSRDICTPQDSIAYIALIHGMDISSCANPIEQAFMIMMDRLDLLSDELKRRIQHPLKDYYSIDLSVKFNPYLPRELYSIGILRRLCRHECIMIPSSTELMDNRGTRDSREHEYMYEQLQLNSVINTFYHGNTGDIVKRETMIMRQELDELPIHSIVSYGTLTCYDSLNPYTYGELFDWFSSCRSFKNPEDNSILPEQSILKLLSLCSSRRREGECVADYQIRIELSQLMKALMEHDDELDELTIRLRDIDIGIVKTFFELLLASAMCMRGWNDEGSEWLSGTHELEQGLIDLNVTRRLDELCSFVSSIPNSISTMLMGLPLMNFTEGTDITHREGEQTIGMRLEIIKLGEDTDTISSCIRISSNYICASCYHYLNSLGYYSFDIRSMRRIS